MTESEKEAKIKEITQRIEYDERQLADITRTPVEEPDRWRVARGGAYHFIYYTGEVKSCLGYRGGDDNLMHKNGNYFKTREDALGSSLYFMLNSEYEYWIPGSSMAKPETMPEGLEYYGGNYDCWFSSEWSPNRWLDYTYRWPKTSYKG
jgi:hypothetical protein